jgi:hypothetical protein
MRHLAIGLCLLTTACSGATPTAPSASLAPIGLASAEAPSASLAAIGLPSAGLSTGPAEPPFNIEVILRGDGFGLVKFRQEKDPTQNIYFMDVWVRDLLPNTSYGLQRAVDSPRDGVCTGTNWLTMGQGTTPQPILTDDTGTGRAALWRAVPATALGSDIHFRVIQTGTSNIALQSGCYPLLVRD